VHVQMTDGHPYERCADQEPNDRDEAAGRICGRHVVREIAKKAHAYSAGVERTHAGIFGRKARPVYARRMRRRTTHKQAESAAPQFQPLFGVQLPAPDPTALAYPCHRCGCPRPITLIGPLPPCPACEDASAPPAEMRSTIDATRRAALNLPLRSAQLHASDDLARSFEGATENVRSFWGRSGEQGGEFTEWSYAHFIRTGNADSKDPRAPRARGVYESAFRRGRVRGEPVRCPLQFPRRPRAPPPRSQSAYLAVR